MQAPWTEIGKLQQDILQLENKLEQKGESHEIYSLNSRMDSLEHSVRQIESSLTSIQYKLQKLSEKGEG